MARSGFAFGVHGQSGCVHGTKFDADDGPDAMPGFSGAAPAAMAAPGLIGVAPGTLIDFGG